MKKSNSFKQWRKTIAVQFPIIFILSVSVTFLVFAIWGNFSYRFLLGTGIFNLMLSSPTTWNLWALGQLLFFCFLFFIIYLFFSRKQLKQLSFIFSGIQKMKAQEKNTSIPVMAENELGDLAQSINNMYAHLLQSTEQVVTAEKQKNELITNMSHDLRTPLTTLVGYLQLLKLKDLDEETTIYVERSFEQANRLKQLTDDLFSLAKLNQLDHTEDTQLLDLNLLITQLVEEQEPILAQDEAIQLELCSEKIILEGNINYLLRMLENLIINAIKHGLKPNNIIIQTKKEGNKCLLMISNPAPFITEESLMRLFDRLYIVDNSRTKQDSSGIGLAIVKRIVELHHGDISVHQEKGNIFFTIKLPIQERT